MYVCMYGRLSNVCMYGNVLVWKVIEAMVSIERLESYLLESEKKGHTYIHIYTYIHTYIHTYVLTYYQVSCSYIYIRIYIHTVHILKNTRLKYTYVYTYIHTYIHSFIHSYIHHRHR